MICDVFLFNGEYDVLEIKLAQTYPFVDRFIIGEASRTFRNNPKEKIFSLDRYSDYADKITYIYMNDAILDNIVKKPYDAWDQDNSQKSFLLTYLNDFIDPPDDSIVFLSDADEIQRGLDIGQEMLYNRIYGLGGLISCYYYNYVCNDSWTAHYRGHQKVCLWKTVKDYKLDFNTIRYNKTFAKIENSNWHFSWIGDAAFIKNKLESYSHQEFDKPEIHARIEEVLRNGGDLLGAGGHFEFCEVSPTIFPAYLCQNIERFKCRVHSL